MGTSVTTEEVLAECRKYNRKLMDVMGCLKLADSDLVWRVAPGPNAREEIDWVLSCQVNGLVNPILCFRLTQMPNCTVFCISCWSKVNALFQGRGIGTMSQDLKLAVAKLLGFRCLVCTCDIGNEPQMRLLEKAGWKLQTQIDRSAMWSKDIR